MKKTLCIALTGLTLLFVGCGSSGSSDGGGDPVEETGVFLDSPVINIGYKTETKEGVTNASGEYHYVEGETVTFFMGDLEFPPVTASGIVTPLDLAGRYITSNSGEYDPSVADPG